MTKPLIQARIQQITTPTYTGPPTNSLNQLIQMAKTRRPHRAPSPNKIANQADTTTPKKLANQQKGSILAQLIEKDQHYMASLRAAQQKTK